MTITYGLEKMLDYWAEVKPLLENTHVPEVAAFQDKMVIGVDEEFYYYCDATSKLHSVIARDKSVVIGYHISIVTHNVHFKTLDKSRSIRNAQVAHYFIHKDYRGKGVGSTMFRYAERSLIGLGVEFLTSEAKSNLPYARLFRHLEWQETAINFSKWLGE